MKTGLLFAGLLMAAATHAGAATAASGHASASGQGPIVVSCFRGPWKEIIWDRPNASFLDSLVANGFSQPAASAVGERICRDDALVGNLQNNIEDVKRVIARAPRS